jgi:hypothetical protein
MKKHRKYTEEQVAQVRELYPIMRTADVAERMGITSYAVYNLAFSLGIKKTPEYMEQMWQNVGAGLAISGEKTRLKKGNVPPNKGKKWDDYLSKEKQSIALQTTYKKGHEPHNTLYDGAFAVREDRRTKRQYIYIRIAKSKWKLYARHVWEQTHGPVPPKHVVRCIDGNSANVVIENLECISQQENMARNSIMQQPEEVRAVYRAVAVLNRAINKRSKK